MKTDNIYIDALKYSMTKMQIGITFKDLYLYLTTTLGWSIEQNYIDYFRQWFYTNFYHKDVYIHLKYGTTQAMLNVSRNMQNYDDLLCVMTSDAYATLKDYEKLQQTRADAKKAHNLALIAILISVVLGIIQIVIPFIQTK